MLPNGLELAQSKQKHFCEVGLVTLQGKTKAYTYLYTKGVTYSKYLGRISKSPNKYILTLRGKDYFRSDTKDNFNGCINKFELSFLSPSQMVKDKEQTNLANKIRPSNIISSVNTPYDENPFKIILK